MENRDKKIIGTVGEVQHTDNKEETREKRGGEIIKETIQEKFPEMNIMIERGQ